jgi:hypothetical protein
MFQSKREKEAQMQQTVSLLQVRRITGEERRAPYEKCLALGF